jgi:predicted DNA-binding transcriptional regulator AlpA
LPNSPSPERQGEIVLAFGDETILSTQEVAQILKLNPRTIDRHSAQGLMPRKIHLGPRRVGFVAGDIRRFIREKAGNQPGATAA